MWEVGALMTFPEPSQWPRNDFDCESHSLPRSSIQVLVKGTQSASMSKAALYGNFPSFHALWQWIMASMARAFGPCGQPLTILFDLTMENPNFCPR